MQKRAQVELQQAKSKYEEKARRYGNATNDMSEWTKQIDAKAKQYVSELRISTVS
jgi:hypothetical protein